MAVAVQMESDGSWPDSSRFGVERHDESLARMAGCAEGCSQDFDA